MEEPSSSSSSESSTTPPSKEAAATATAAESTVDKCPVCLQLMKAKRKAYAPLCFHSFCYDCLLEWTKIKLNCPLCKRDLDRIVYEIKSRSEFKEHYLSVDPEADEQRRQRTMTLPLEIIGYRPGATAAGADDPYDFFRRRAQHAAVEPGAGAGEAAADKAANYHKASFVLNREAAPPDFRSLVYLNAWYANPSQTQANIQVSQVDLMNNSGEELLDEADSDQESIELAQTLQAAMEGEERAPPPLFVQYKLASKFRNIAPKWFRNNPASTHRIMQFIYRELKALAAIATQKYRLNQCARHTLLTKIVELIKQIDIKSEQFFLEIGPFIRPSRVARHFVHELHSYARSICHDLADYDASVVYYAKADFVSLEEEEEMLGSSGKPVAALPVNLNKYRLTERKSAPPVQTAGRFNFFQNMPFAATVNVRVNLTAGSPPARRQRAAVMATTLRVLTPPPQVGDQVSDSDRSSFCEEIAPSPKKSPEYIVVSSSDDEDGGDGMSSQQGESKVAAKKRLKQERMAEEDEDADDSESRPGTSKDLAERHHRRKRKHHKHRRHHHHHRRPSADD